ncbi:hypothetical protein QVD17_00909 [Tagetes erecta]|uniref:Uncharacterized protein n=1 Tax=Tagetes erecta TaxID=13708 RepID=A0AAD8L404_TARER|nr:hypothetical protein QVD17_00909 [Tagetes erecta]
MDVVAKWKWLSRSVLHQRKFGCFYELYWWFDYGVAGGTTSSLSQIREIQLFVKAGSGCKNKATNQQGPEWLKKYMKLSLSSLNVLKELTLMTTLQKESPLNPRRNMRTHWFLETHNWEKDSRIARAGGFN